MNTLQKILGVIYVAFGASIFLLVAGELVFRLFLAVVALYIINAGLTKCGFYPTRAFTRIWMSKGMRF